MVIYNSVQNKYFTKCVVCGIVHTLQQCVLSFPNVVGLVVLGCVISHMLTRRVQPTLCRFAWNLQMFDSSIHMFLEL